LIVSAVIIIGYQELHQQQGINHVKQTVSVLENMIPPIQNGQPSNRGNYTMPCLELDGVDYIGLIEAPSLHIKLPIGNAWSVDQIQQHPCRYDGSMYNRSLILGGIDHVGQFGFLSTMSIGDAIYITDVTGVRFTYSISSVERANEISDSALSTQQHDLVLFTKDSLHMDYVIIHCVAQQCSNKKGDSIIAITF